MHDSDTYINIVDLTAGKYPSNLDAKAPSIGITVSPPSHLQAEEETFTWG
jgi:hypothetical protein